MVYASQARLYINTHDHSNSDYYADTHANRHRDANTQQNTNAVEDTLYTFHCYPTLDSDRIADKPGSVDRVTNISSADHCFNPFVISPAYTNQCDPTDIHTATAYQSTAYRASNYRTSTYPASTHG
jgi:hypothetical protein